jgi:hypothetical protein
MKFKKYFPILPILILALFLRFYRLDEIFIFNFDDEYQANLAWSLVKDFHLIWIGVSASFTDFYLGPYFTYFSAIILFLSKGDPLPTAYVAVFTGIVTTAMLFYVGWKFFNPITGIVAALLYAALPLFIFYDQRYWNPMFNLWIILLMFFALSLVKKSKWWWVFYTAVIGIMLNTHLASAPLLLIGAWQFFKLKVYREIKLIIICLGVFLLFYWPLIVFDINHNYSNMTAFFRSGENGNSIINPQSKLNSALDSMARFWYLEPGNSNSDEVTFSCTSLSFPKDPGYEIDKFTDRTYGNLWLKILSVGIFIWFIIYALKSSSQNTKLLFSFVSVLFLSYIFYPGGSFEYYNLGFLCLFTLIVGLFISNLKRNPQYFSLGVLLLIVTLGIFTIINVSPQYGLVNKKLLIAEVMSQVKQEPFAIDAKGLCHDYEGWRYLFKSYGLTPVQSFTDKNFAWIYPDEITNTSPKFNVTLIENRIAYEFNDKSKIIKVGGFSAIIEDNK